MIVQRIVVIKVHVVTDFVIVFQVSMVLIAAMKLVLVLYVIMITTRISIVHIVAMMVLFIRMKIRVMWLVQRKFRVDNREIHLLVFSLVIQMVFVMALVLASALLLFLVKTAALEIVNMIVASTDIVVSNFLTHDVFAIMDTSVSKII
jgi:hypothetical protein